MSTALEEASHRDKSDPSELANLEITTNIAVPEHAEKPGIRGWMATIIFAVLISALVAVVFLAPAREMKGGAAILLMLVLMFTKLPVALSLAIPGLLGIYALAGPRALANVAGGIPYTAVASWSLSVLPMFILMGLLLWSSGLTGKLYVAARHWLSFLPGGLAVGTNVAGTGLAAVSGSTIGTTFALARVGVPEMLRAGYDKKYAVSAIVVAGLPGQLIPPSTFLVIVAGLIGVPVGAQLIAGVVPGLVVAGMTCLMLIAFAIAIPRWVGRARKGEQGVTQVKSTWADRFNSGLWVLPIAAIVFIVFGGIFTGFFTATEAGAIGAVLALLVAVVMQWKNKPLKQVVNGLVTAVSSVGAIFLMLIGAHMLGQLLAISGLTGLFGSLVSDIGLDRVTFLFLVMAIYIILGMFMDPLAILLTTLPILLPMLVELDVSLLWFGVFAVFMGELAILTPPVGILSFVIHSILQDPDVNLGQKVLLTDVFKAVGIMFPVLIAFGAVMILFPEIATWLPSLMSN